MELIQRRLVLLVIPLDQNDDKQNAYCPNQSDYGQLVLEESVHRRWPHDDPVFFKGLYTGLTVLLTDRGMEGLYPLYTYFYQDYPVHSIPERPVLCVVGRVQIICTRCSERIVVCTLFVPDDIIQDDLYSLHQRVEIQTTNRFPRI